MTNGDHHIAPWRELWSGRLRRPAALMLAVLAFTVGFHLVFSERLDWIGLGVQLAALEVLVVLAGSPQESLPSPDTLHWMRHFGLRLAAYGAVAAAAATAALLAMTPPVATPLLVALLTLFGGGGFALLFGGSMVFWSFPGVRLRGGIGRPHPKLMALMSAGMVLASAYAVIMRGQRTGALEAPRMLGFALVVVGVTLPLLRLAANPGDDSAQPARSPQR